MSGVLRNLINIHKTSHNVIKETSSVLQLFIDFFLSGGAVCVFECLSASLALQEIFLAINFHSSRTTEHQPTRNPHSSAQLFAVPSATCNYQIPQNS